MLTGDVLVELLSHDRMKATFASLSKACRSGMWKLIGEEQVVTFLQDSILNHVLGGTKNPKSLVMLYLKYSSIALPIYATVAMASLFWVRSFNGMINLNHSKRRIQQSTSKCNMICFFYMIY